MEQRKYLLMTAKHSSVRHPLFWGQRTNDNEKRSFGNYTDNFKNAEHYTMKEILAEFPSTNIFGGLPSEYPNIQVYDFNSDQWSRQRGPNTDVVFAITERQVRFYTDAVFD